MTKHTVEDDSGGPRDSNAETTGTSMSVAQACKHAQLCSSMRCVNVLHSLCFAKRKVASGWRYGVCVRSHARKFWWRREGIPESALGHRTVAASDEKAVGRHLASN